MKKSLIAATVLLSAAASTAGAQFVDNNLRGSDTLFNFTNNLADNLNIAPADLTYIGTGSGNGQTDIVVTGDQEIAPMSRFLTNATCVAATGPATAGCWRVGRDLLAIYGNEGSACDALVYDEAITVTDANGNGSVDCPGCGGASGNEFSTSDWRAVLRVVYAGQLSLVNGTVDCNSDVRRTLVNNWNTLFAGECATGSCTGGLRRAFRRDDFSGTTDSFLELLGLPAQFNYSVTPAAFTARFCNGDDRSDNDPIRRPCDQRGYNGLGEEVCRLNATSIPNPGATFPFTNPTPYHLGLVLPVSIPAVDPYAADDGAPFDQNCGTSANGGAASGKVLWSPLDTAMYAGSSSTVCPNGSAVKGGNCSWPRRAGAPAGTGFGCIASARDRPGDSVSAFQDARVFNLIARNNNGSLKTYVRGTTNQRANRSFYKIHQLNGCTYADATDNIACFANSDECAIGFAGNGALNSLTELTDIVGIGLKNKNGVAETVYPVEEDFASYGLARFLYICTHDDFASVVGTGGLSQSPEFIQAQQDIKAELNSPTGSQAVADAMNDAGFLGFPSNQQLFFDQCPESLNL